METMEKYIRLEIPAAWVQGLFPQTSDSIREAIRLGLHQLKIQEALKLYQAGGVSLGYAAEKMGLSKRELIREARSRGIEPLFDEQTICEETGKCHPE